MSFNADVWHYMVSVIQINVGAFEYVLDMAAATRVFVPVIRQLFFPAHVHFPPISGENPGERILDAGILIIEVPFFEQPVVRVVGRIGEELFPIIRCLDFFHFFELELIDLLLPQLSEPEDEHLDSHG